MDASLDIAVAAIALVPLLAAAAAPWLVRAFGAGAGWLLAAVPAASFAFLCTLLPEVAGGGRIAAALGWGPAHGLALSFLVDGLSLTFALTIAGIGAFVLAYSGAYLAGHRHLGRYFSFLLLFMGAMQGLVLADSTVALYAFWELTTVASFLLIGFDHSRQAARRAAIQALVITTLGGLTLLAAGVLMQQLTGAWELSSLGAIDLRAHPAYGAILVLVLVAAFTKSAQFPFHVWLPNAMEAPTPVSAFLHSATMVQGGVYLLARLSPALGGTPEWSAALIGGGGLTLLWGAVAALRQTDLKQMLAQTTVASLGLLVLLIGIGTEAAIMAAVLYFVAHALYKAGLFLVAGIIDHETGTRELPDLGGLRRPLAVTFVAAVLAAASMVGLPPLVGYLAKEEMYLALLGDAGLQLLLLAVLVAGNGLLAAVALTVALKPFLGPLPPLPKTPHEPPVAMLAGPVTLGVLGLMAGVATGWLGEWIVSPATLAIAGAAHGHLVLGLDPFGLLFWLSVLTWAVGGLVTWRLEAIRAVLRRWAGAIGWSFDKGFDAAMFGLIRLSAAVTHLWHHGRLELYLVVLFLMLALATIVPLWSLGGLPAWPEAMDLTFYEWGTVLIAVIGVATVVAARTRLFAILALGIQGFAVALLYLLFGAPDLSFTQFMVEILSVVILTLVMTRLRLDKQDLRVFEDLLRDGGLAVLCGLGITALLFAVLQGELDPLLAEFFNANSAPVAHGHNVVNVILVDFRGLDTLGEISVVMTAGIAILALIRGARRDVPAPPPKPPARRRRRAATGAAA